jgi:hypothetical protein
VRDLNQIGEADGWRCWLCDMPVDPDASVNSDLGPSADSFALAKSKKGASGGERLAHRACNTMKGKMPAVVAWPAELLVAEPAPIVETVERLVRKGGRELVVLALKMPKLLPPGCLIALVVLRQKQFFQLRLNLAVVSSC